MSKSCESNEIIYIFIHINNAFIEQIACLQQNINTEVISDLKHENYIMKNDELDIFGLKIEH
jgi:hypothetical protein